MKCPFCGFSESKVIDSRAAEDGTTIKRRRECLECQKRYTTYEKIETLPIMVVKRDQSREPFDKNKILKGLVRATMKRGISMEQMEKIADDIERNIANRMTAEISSEEIGTMVLERLKELDEVAYIRFASVYREFRDINTFIEEINSLKGVKNK